ncbi:GNAT family N-acetyltransferase [Pseudarthrobacter sp. J75]|uniref:GNAT family N-acetyltransferase n=1 Tax=unclassified Pseudarthrobacter TaxID=2647000 RepID=UPI002E813B02|nr:MULTISPECIES: GNAT family N-acetyltransferase [unclassified Pseudarthrobacter]MEE2522575.1 GNAT family N-acetyltransferase [Pseudarthrobacter sp. J47]MEE2529080.1 GNAT family N-acetyltransferase [Pseudarthrobacter sp. J75]MEE2570811.1 GNAT family N-acetyltransferase [Pseudarthrobacter sp. J64]
MPSAKSIPDKTLPIPSSDGATPAPIETPRLTLRLTTEVDAAAIHQYRSRADVTRFLSHGPLSVDETRERTSRSIGLAAASTSEWFMYPWTMVDRETGQLVGDARVWNASEASPDGCLLPGSIGSDQALLGYVLDPAHHGRGLGREAAGALVNWLFTERRVNSILAAVYEPNLPSRRLLESLGFVQDLYVPASSDRHGKNMASLRMRLDRPSS